MRFEAKALGLRNDQVMPLRANFVGEHSHSVDLAHFASPGRVPAER